MQKHMLFVEDDAIIRANYTDLLTDEGFDVAAFADRQAAMDYAQETMPDLALLDISLSGERDAGYQLCADLRRLSPQLPIIFLSSHDSELDKISGIRLGADDYLTKDISVDYLIIRIEALLRRFEALTGPESISPDHRTRPQSSALRIDDAVQALYWQQRKVELTLTQYWIVKTLADQPGQAKNAEQLMHAAHLCVEPNTISAHLKTIRERFRAIDPDFNCIKTERGIGYRWVEV